jgi:hypothetical protein
MEESEAIKHRINLTEYKLSALSIAILLVEERMILGDRIVA